MNLLNELTALRDPHRFSFDDFRQALAEAWAGLERMLSDPRFLSLRGMLGVHSDDEARTLRTELIRLRTESFEVPGTPEGGPHGVGVLLERSGYPAIARMLRGDSPLLFELTAALLGDVKLQPLVHELRRVEAEDREAEVVSEEEPSPRPGVVRGMPTPASTTTPTTPTTPPPARAPIPRKPTVPAGKREAADEDEEDHEDEEDMDEAAETARATSRRKRKARVSREEEETTFRRRASVRWYRRMNPLRMYPLNIVLAQGRLREPLRPGQAQAAAKEQLVLTKDDPFVRIRPVLPGCTVYPDEQVVDATPAQVEVRFQVVPQMLGTVADARIEFYQQHRLLTKIDLPIVVSKQTVAVVLASLGLAWPVVGTVVRSVAGETAGEPKDLLMRALTWAMAQPHALEIGLGLGALAAAIWWWWNRPTESSAVAGLDELQPMSVAELLQAAKVALLRGDRAEARSCAEDALNLDPMNSIAADLLRRARE
jgi:hypothetical protein